jgi:hypothetical protein
MANRILTTLLAFGAVAAVSSLAHADTYPVSGTWTYERANQAGASKDCGQKIMRFDGNIRHDTGTSVPDYRNRSLTQDGEDTWHVIDDFYNLLQRGRVSYSLRRIDADHIELQFDRGGSSLLRRCI